MRRQETVSDGTVSIVTIIDEPEQGPAPNLVILPSSSRDSLDFDDIAERFAREGFRVIRPQPRGMAGSTGPMTGLTLHDLANDVALVIERTAGSPAFVLGHAFGQWIGRCVAADHPKLVRGVILAAAAAKNANPALREELAKCVDTSLPDSVRLAALSIAFFAPGHDPSSWLDNWHPEAAKTQRAATAATQQEDWWAAGSAPVLDIQAELDPWRPASTRNGMREDLGEDRVTVVVIPDASHALIPEQPDALVQTVLSWTRRIAGEPT
ncbi:MAG TPA: alpha/beta hydrolase [Rhodopila sp.]|nr:alpha/beta hydrolase [Rhodopila sp.]